MLLLANMSWAYALTGKYELGLMLLLANMSRAYALTGKALLPTTHTVRIFYPYTGKPSRII
jgi:hypothetical protein